MHKQSKRRKYSNTDFTKPGYSLEPGTKGFLCTFNNREKECVRESYNILNKYADRLYGAENVGGTSNSQEENDGDIEDDLERELKVLKSESANVKKRRFQVVKSGAKNVLFVRTTIDDPVALAVTIVNEIKDTKRSQTRFLIRLVPIEITCKAYMDDIKKASSTLLEKNLKDNDKSFSIVYNRRNNCHLDRDKVIEEVASVVLQIPGKHAVDLTCPDVSIIIEIIKNVALLAVVPNYMVMRKFNLHAFNNDEVKDFNDTEVIKENKVKDVKKGSEEVKEDEEKSLEKDT